MKFLVLTIFPEMVHPFRDTGIIRRAVERGMVAIEPVNIRDYAMDRHRSTDDRPYGGGSGMVMTPEPLAAAVREAKADCPAARVVLMSPQGRPFCQAVAREMAAEPALILVCGRYEGVDERFCEQFVDDELSVGDFVLTGGELPALMVVDAVTRLLPDALGGPGAAENDSFSEGLLEHAHYTRPRVFEGSAVPEVLISGDHQRIAKWRREEALLRTVVKRPDLLESHPLDAGDRAVLKRWNGILERVLADRA